MTDKNTCPIKDIPHAHAAIPMEMLDMVTDALGYILTDVPAFVRYVNTEYPDLPQGRPEVVRINIMGLQKALLMLMLNPIPELEALIVPIHKNASDIIDIERFRRGH